MTNIGKEMIIVDIRRLALDDCRGPELAEDTL